MSGLTPRPGIMDIQPYVGGQSTAEGAERVYKLASNENDLGPSPDAIKAYHDAAAELHRYPDGGAYALRTAIAEVHGLDADRIVCGGGSDEILTLLTRAYAGADDHVLYSEHGFLMYPINAKAVAAVPSTAPEKALTADVDALLANVTERTRIVFLANPNNPTGTYLPRAELERLHAGLPDNVLLVIDAAYAEYIDAPDYDAGTALVDAAENVVMTRTFSKAYGLAALRLGWAYCSASVADVLNRVRNPFNVTSPAQAAGAAAVRDQDHIAKVRAYNDKWRSWTAEKARALGIDVTEGAANFILLNFPAEGPYTVDAVYDALMADGIILRKMAGYGLPNSLRVTIGTGEAMEAMIASLGRILER